ncbi:MAG: hypothetical protein JW880_03650 [Candidatus Thermoplasmatota archaeon]|nr:hypothetical protein [Candidatus Thermoplasmatota archaeon]
MAERLLKAPIRMSRARLFGLALILASLVLLLLALDAQIGIDEIGETNDPLLQERLLRLEDRRDAFLVTAIGTVFMGLFAIAMLGEPSTPTIVSGDQMVATAKMTGGILGALSLAGSSLYLPARHGLEKEKVFVPATSGPATPPAALTEDMVVSPGKDGSTPGAIVEPLGLGLLDSVESELRTKIEGAGLEAAEGTLQILKHGLGILKDFHFKEREGKTVLRVEYKSLAEACRTVRKQRPDTCRQMQCVGCSCLLVAAARASGKVVAVEEVDNSTDTVVFTLDLREW